MTARRIAPFLLAAPALLFGILCLHAGPLNPPAGPVTSTYKTLSEVEPRIAVTATNTPGDATSLYKITQPGSYYLTGNITGVAGKHGIAIATSGVTLDLNGFDLAGVGGTGAFDGVIATVGGVANIAVLNGSVRAWGGDGIALGSTSLTCRVVGILANGNAGNGIVVGYACTVTGCSANSNTGNGLSASTGTIFSNCTAQSNTGNGIILVGPGNAVLACTTNQNGGSGISATALSTISNCAAAQNSGNGITAGTGSTISTCTATFGGARGINAGNACTVSGCTTLNNQSDGIAVNYSCTVTGNTCNGDGLATGSQGGIHVFGQANRVESNNVTYADVGVLADSGGNVIARNTVKGCTTNWSVVAGNTCLVVQGVVGGAISGNTGGVAPGSTDPNANFSY